MLGTRDPDAAIDRPSMVMRPTVDGSVDAAGRGQFGLLTPSLVRILMVPLRIHSACSALSPVPLGI